MRELTTQQERDNMNKTTITKKDGEYRVRLFVNDVYQAGADYFTDDRQDALDTAHLMEKNGVESDKTTDFAKEEQAKYEEEKGVSVWFDVCNDYSLDMREEKPGDLENYRQHFATVNGLSVSVYTHKEYEEVHYARGSHTLQGEIL